MKKEITVLIPSYNHGNVIENQIDSLLNQSKDVKIIICDDGSTDCTGDKLNKYNSIASLKILKNPHNMGMHATISRLLNHVSTQYFCIAAADDILLPGWANTAMESFYKYTDSKAFISNTYIKKFGKMYETNSFPFATNSEINYLPQKKYIDYIIKHGRFAPTNTLVMDSCLIEDIVFPMYNEKQSLGVMSDVLMLSQIASEYSITYTSQSLGIFTIDFQSFGNSSFTLEKLGQLTNDMRDFLLTSKINDLNFKAYLNRYVAYNIKKGIILHKLRSENKIFVKSICYLNLIKLLVKYDRWRYIFQRPALSLRK